MLFIEYPKCTTCQKARKWLESTGLPFNARHIKDNPPTAGPLVRTFDVCYKLAAICTAMAYTIILQRETNFLEPVAPQRFSEIVIS